MNIIQAIVLGVVQGLTEFLPVSSSGHLVLTQSVMKNFSQPGILFDTLLHFGTFFAVVIYFYNSLIKISYQDLKLLIVGTIPAGVVGILFEETITGLFSSVTVVGFALLVTAILNILTHQATYESNGRKVLSIKDALIVGVAQAFAIIPGISRSGSTIFAGTQRGLNRKKAAEFSFILSMPAILGANIIQLYQIDSFDSLDVQVYFAGFVAAVIVGLFAIWTVIKFLESKWYWVFSLYCFLLGTASLLLL